MGVPWHVLHCTYWMSFLLECRSPSPIASVRVWHPERTPAGRQPQEDRPHPRGNPAAVNRPAADIEMTFPYFIDKEAPVTKARGLMEYICHFSGSMDENGVLDLVVGITVPITTLCPCSKEISQVGAHNQRGEVRVQVRYKKFFWIEDLIRLVEESASCEVYALLKRQDEKFVTEKAYSNPMFVEDVVREIAHHLSQNDNFTWYAVESENFESIHNHSAYAYIESN